MYHRILPIVLLCLAGLTLLINRPVTRLPGQAASGPATPATQYDYYVRGFQLSSYNPAGQLHYTLQGQRLQHSDGTYETFEVEAPAIHILSGPWSQWGLAAEKASFSEKNRTWRLDGNVTLQKQQGDQFPFSIQSQKMAFIPESRLLTTSSGVRIAHPHGTTRSKGLKIDLDTSRLQLNHNVHSRFNP